MLLREADTAMYRAKSAGKARVEVFSPALRRGVAERRALKRSLRKAVEREELRLQYQPIVRFADGVVAGLEALVRWDAPGMQRRMPEDFIAVSEESGSIVTHRALGAGGCLPAGTCVAAGHRSATTCP